MRQEEVIDAVQTLIKGDAASRAKIIKLFPLGLRFVLGRYPQDALAIKWDGTAEGADHIYCPRDFWKPLTVWTGLREEPVTIISPAQFAILEAQEYSGTQIFCCYSIKKGGRKQLEFIDDIGIGTAVTMRYLQSPALASVDSAPDYLADALVCWIRLMMATEKTFGIANRQYERAIKSVVPMSDVTPSAPIVGRIPRELRGGT